MEKKQMTPKVVLSKFFRRPSDTLKDFVAELTRLSPEEQHELAELAAVELGVELVEAK